MVLKKVSAVGLRVENLLMRTATKPDTYLLPRWDDCIDSFGKAKAFKAFAALWK